MRDPTAIDITTDPLTKRMEGVTVHGGMHFNVPFISHIEGNLFIGGCENGMKLPTNIVHLVSLYPWEQYKVKHELKSYTRIYMYDAVPDVGMLDGLAGWAAACIDEAPTLIHCQAGLNRSALIAALALCKRGLSPEYVIALLRRKRSPAVLCNRSFEEFILSFGGRR